MLLRFEEIMKRFWSGRSTRCCGVAAVLLLLSGVKAETLEQVGAGVREELKAALAELADVQAGIEAERVPLVRDLRELEDKVLAMRTELTRSQRESDNQLVALGVLRKEVDKAREDARFVQALLSEYLGRFESRVHISEVERFSDRVEKSRVAPSLKELSGADRFSQQAQILEAGLDRLEALVGGDRFQGRALTPDGTLEDGTYALLGPVALFHGSESGVSGVAELRLGSPKPRCIPVGTALDPLISGLVADGRGSFPLDPTLGNALKIAEKKDSIVAHVMKGGPVMAPILLFGFTALIIALVKWFELSRIRTVSPMELQRVLSCLHKGDGQGARSISQGISGPVGDLLSVALEHAKEQKEFLEEVLYEKMLEARPKLERLLPIIALTAATAPLLGLLGTVTGMINTFNMITIFGAGDPRTLSGGISEALITTEFGLIVAIPSLLLHAFISRRVKSVLGSMEQTSVAFINGVPDPVEEGAPAS
ncbi:MAG: Biopolymer transport protein ExbB [Verrucomicrobiota bacterium]